MYILLSGESKRFLLDDRSISNNNIVYMKASCRRKGYTMLGTCSGLLGDVPRCEVELIWLRRKTLSADALAPPGTGLARPMPL